MEKKGIPFRQIHLDFHTSPLIGDIGAEFDAEEFADTLKKAHVNSINLFTKCHHGMYYYPTAVGTMHPELTFDLFGAQVQVCRENKIRPVAYTCVSWNEDWAKRHLEWLMVNTEGIWGNKKPFDNSYYSWKCICYNNKDYQEILKAEMKEVYDRYHPDGFWIDIVQGKGCVCGTCSEDMKILGLDPERPEDVRRFDKISETRFCRTFYKYLKALDENLEVYFNAFPYELDDGTDPQCSSIEKRKYFDFLDIESLPSEQWGYTHFPVAANYLNKYKKDICMMNGKFHTAWGDFGSLRHENALEYECFRAIANGAGVCVGDQMHPCGKLDQVVYERIGRIFEQIEHMEPWLYRTEKVREIAVLIPSRAGACDPSSGGMSEEGVYRVLSELHHPFDFVNQEDSLADYRLLILPDHAELDQAYAEKIGAFLDQGGKILVSGTSGLKDGKSILPGMDLVHEGKSPYDVRYLRMRDSRAFPEVPKTDHVLYEAGEQVSGSGNVLAEIVDPYFSRTYEHFCSHRQTPPKRESRGEPAILETEAGIYMAFPVFRMYTDSGYTVYRDLTAGCIRRLLKEPLIETDLPALTELNLRRQGQNYILHMLNYVVSGKAKMLDTIEEKFMVKDKSIRIRTGYSPAAVVRLPLCEKADFHYENGYTEIMIDYSSGYEAFLIEQ